MYLSDPLNSLLRQSSLADIIYHLFDKFTAYNQEITEAKRRDAAPQAVWPCRLKIIAAFCKRDPIILGVDILDGTLRVGTPLAVVKVDPTTQKKEIIDLGKVYVYNPSLALPFLNIGQNVVGNQPQVNGG